MYILTIKRAGETNLPRRTLESHIMSITVTLSAANMGQNATEADFAAWTAYVESNIERDLGFAIGVEQSGFTSGANDDRIVGATDEQRECIEAYLGQAGWDAFCAAGGVST